MVSGGSALLLLGLMFVHWYGVELVNTSLLLFKIESTLPGKSAWGALGWISVVLAITVAVTLIASTLRVVGVSRRVFLTGEVLVTGLGLLSTALIAYRIIDPPVFFVEGPITAEGSVEPVVVVALLAATGIAVGGWLELRDDR